MNRSVRIFFLVSFAMVFGLKAQTNLPFAVDSLSPIPGTALSHSSTARVGDRIYTIFGRDAFGNLRTGLYYYEISRDRWRYGDFFPGQGREHTMTYVHGNKIFFVNGSRGTVRFFNEIWSYDLVSESWNQEPPFPGPGRGEAVSVRMGSYIYMGIGRDSTGLLHDWYRLDPSTGSWKRLPDFPGGGRSLAAGVALNGEVIVGMGQKDSSVANDFFAYSPISGVWREMPWKMDSALIDAKMTVINGEILVIGGEKENGELARYHRFVNPNNGTIRYVKISTFPKTGFSLVEGDLEFYTLFGTKLNGQKTGRVVHAFREEPDPEEEIPFIVEVNPNPVTGNEIIIQTNSAIEYADLYDLGGRKQGALNLANGWGWVWLGIPSVTPGHYLLIIGSLDGQKKTVRLFINN
ncbi:MAG: hypothetical protein LPK80_08160 [Bacteroidota bacterium]|nr:hypothetical protein [Bacteroidota bacterium]